MFQEPRLLPWRSVEDNVRLVAPLADEAKLSALFEILELNAHRNHFPGELSLGLARRVALARAFAVEPAFLILDEPLASLDAALAARMRDQIAMLMDNRSMITLLVTHDVDDAVRLGDRLFLLSPRPARLLAELPIRTPRGARGDAEIAAIKLDVMRRINGDPSARESLIGSARGACYVTSSARLTMKRSIGTAALGLVLVTMTATAQDMMRHIDLSSPDMVSAEMTRGEVEAALAAATATAPADFTGKRLSGLDLSGLNLSGAIFRAARLNKTKLAGARLDRAILDQAWLLEADLTGASLRGANLFASQMVRARLDGADLSGARIAADLTGASLVGASIAGANLGADMRNQSMGLMRAILKSANLEGLNARGADLSRVDLEFAALKGGDLTGASLKGAQLGGADLTGITVIDTDFEGADLNSARLIAPIGLDRARNFDKAKNLERLIKQ